MMSSFAFQFRRSVYTGSIGKVLATYAPVESAFRPPFFSKKGLSERFFRLKTYFRNIFSTFFIQKSLNDFSRKMFINEAMKTYSKFLESFYSSDINSLRAISTPNLFSEINSKYQKLELKSHASPNSIKITKIPTMIQILPVKMQIPQTIEIYQITVKFEYEIDGQKYTDFVVFERSAASSDSTWRICGRVLPNSQYY